jgi:DNA-binding transcriptional LysR family regulator
VRAFDAVARLGSVRAAADELAVTPAAVSQQLRVLEAHLGLALTQRQGRGLALTDSGRTWHGEIARHLRAIALAAERVRPGRRVVQVTVVQSFGSRWLMPRLTKFTAREPEIEVRIDASPVLADFARDPFDLAIREGRGNYDTELVRLFELCVLSGREPAGRAHRMRRRNGTLDWSRARLLHEVTYDYWPGLVHMAEADDVDVARGSSSATRCWRSTRRSKGRAWRSRRRRLPSASLRAARSRLSIRGRSCPGPASGCAGRAGSFGRCRTRPPRSVTG